MPEKESDDPITMRILTRNLDNWQTDAWLVELSESIRPVQKEIKEYDDGTHGIERVAMPYVSHVVVSKSDLAEAGGEVMVFPAFASGEYRGLSVGKLGLAGRTWGTHYDALDDLADEFVGVECNLEGPREHGTIEP